MARDIEKDGFYVGQPIVWNPEFLETEEGKFALEEIGPEPFHVWARRLNTAGDDQEIIPRRGYVQIHSLIPNTQGYWPAASFIPFVPDYSPGLSLVKDEERIPLAS